jgi:hypothetical protein
LRTATIGLSGNSREAFLYLTSFIFISYMAIDVPTYPDIKTENGQPQGKKNGEVVQGVAGDTSQRIMAFLPDSPPSDYHHTSEQREPPTTNPIALLFKDSTPP